MLKSYHLGVALRRVVRPGVGISESRLTKHRAHFSSCGNPPDGEQPVIIDTVALESKLEAQGLASKQVVAAIISAVNESLTVKAESQSEKHQLSLLQSEIQIFRGDLERMCSDLRNEIDKVAVEQRRLQGLLDNSDNAKENSQINELQTAIHELSQRVEETEWDLCIKTGVLWAVWVLAVIYPITVDFIFDFLSGILPSMQFSLYERKVCDH